MDIDSISTLSRSFLFVPYMSSCCDCCPHKSSKNCNSRQRLLPLLVSIRCIITCTLSHYGGLQWHSTLGAWSQWSRGLLVNCAINSANLMPIHSRYVRTYLMYLVLTYICTCICIYTYTHYVYRLYVCKLCMHVCMFICDCVIVCIYVCDCLSIKFPCYVAMYVSLFNVVVTEGVSEVQGTD